MSELAERAAIVTGAAMGIGRASALKLARAGAAVTVADIDTPASEKTVREIRDVGGRALFIRADARCLADAERTTKPSIEAWGRVDILVNNAARAIGGVVDEIEDAWNLVISTNLTSVWRFMRCVAPHMRRQGAARSSI
jgi:NAD(P)-dependent dehydrogenase (short-subunit alcohol dehydrogenase family)